MAAVQVVLFDAVGTLLHPEPAVAVAYHAVGRRFGSRLSPEDIEPRFRAAFARQESIDQAAGHQTDEARERARWQAIVGEVFSDVPDPSDLFTALWEHFAQPRHWAVYPDVAECWRRLAARGLELGLASNFDARLESICRGIEPLSACRWVFASSCIGHRKPSPTFFQAVQQSLRLPADAILLVGDDRHNDFQAARAAGWQAILLDRQSRPDSSTPHVIASLEQLPGLLGPPAS
jgi:putative hydrolase of the HAD superfamily